MAALKRISFVQYSIDKRPYEWSGTLSSSKWRGGGQTDSVPGVCNYNFFCWVSCGRQKRQHPYNSLLDDDLGHVICSDPVVNLDLEYFTSHHIDFKRLMVRWCWVSFQCRSVLHIWSRVGQGPTVLAVGAVGVVWIFLLSPIISLFFLPLSGRRPDIDWNTVSKGR